MGSQTEGTILASKYSFLSGIPIMMAQGFGRIAFAFTLLSVMGTTPARQWFLYTIIAFQFIWLVVVLALSYGLCSPVSAFWDSAQVQAQECLVKYHNVVVDGWNYFETGLFTSVHHEYIYTNMFFFCSLGCLH